MKKIFALFKTKKFYIYFLILFCLLNYIFDWSVFSFWLFWIWTEQQNMKLGSDYIKTSNFDDTVLWVVSSNINFWERYDFSSDSLFFSKAINFFEKSQTLVETDILNLLEGWADKKTILWSYLSQLQRNSEDMRTLNQELSHKIQTTESQMQECLQEKERWDSLFFQGMQNDDKNILLDGFVLSMKKWPCFYKKRIRKNAYKALQNKSNKYLPLIEQKYYLILNNKDIILNNINLFRNNYLERMTSIKKQLESYKVTNW